MSEVTRILSQMEAGDPTAAEKLLPLVYDELRKLAAAKMAREKPGQTLQATALIHEAYLRLVDGEQTQEWKGRGHFFGAAARAMRRILIERARRKKRLKRGGRSNQISLDDAEVEVGITDTAKQLDLLALDEALTKLAAEAPLVAEIVQLRFFAGLSHEEVAAILGVSPITVKRHWRYGRVWLLRQLEGTGSFPEE